MDRAVGWGQYVSVFSTFEVNRDYPHPLKAKLRQNREHQEIVPRQTRKVIDQYCLESLLFAPRQQRGQPRSVLARARGRHVAIDLGFLDYVAPLRCEFAAG